MSEEEPKTETTNGDSSTSSSFPDSNWSKDKLTGRSASSRGLSASLESTSESSSSRRLSKSASKRKSMQKENGTDPSLWGRPGHLTDEEADVYLKFKETVDSRGGDFADTVYSFGRDEGEVYALCRWLRARKFDFDLVVKMVEEATKCREDAKIAEFYPEPKVALGCDTAVYAAQYPQVYSGFAKNGSPLFISKIGILNIDAVDCVTTVASVVKYHWHVMMHDFANRLRSHKKNDPNFHKYECVCVMDLEHLTMGQLNSRTLAIVKEQSAIDSLCFPETLNKMYIVNTPRFFSATWSVIKGWLDPRTAKKVEVLSGRKHWQKALLEYVEADQLPSDYGGTGPNTKDTMDKETFTGKLKRMHTQVLYLRTSNSVTFEVFPGEELEVTIFTRSMAGVTWSIIDSKNKNGTTWVSDIVIKHHSDDPEMSPTNKQLTNARIKGPVCVEIKGKSLGSRFSTQNCLVVLGVYSP